MDNRPIGVFDSGVGGLTAVRAMLRDYPNESIVYFGDTARVPYGNREKDDITNLSLQDVRFLRSKGVKAVLIACNTITCNAGEELSADNPDVPVVGTVDAAAAAAAAATKNGRIGIIATAATVRSGAESAKAIIKTLTETGGLAETDAKAEVNYYCSARLNDFETIAQVFLNKDIHGSAFEINIEEY